MHKICNTLFDYGIGAADSFFLPNAGFLTLNDGLGRDFLFFPERETEKGGEANALLCLESTEWRRPGP